MKVALKSPILAIAAPALTSTLPLQRCSMPCCSLAYAWIMDQAQVDVFLTYCTNAVAA